jgi:hypothetical protein
MNRSCLFSRLRHCRRFWVRRHKRCVSTFLHPFARPELPGFNATMDALTPVRKDCGPNRSPCLTSMNLPSIPSPSTPCRPSKRVWFNFWAYRASPSRRTARPQNSGDVRQLGFAINEQARHDSRPKRVCQPTDWMFTSGCSPPRLTATQLPSITKFRLTSAGTRTLLVHRARKRT